MTSAPLAAGSPARRGPLRGATLVHLLVFAITCGSLIAFVRFFGAEFGAAFALLLDRASVARMMAYLVYSLAVLGLLGGAWLAASGEDAALLGTFVWARIVRDAAADLLPFSQIGAIVIGFRVVLRRGIQSSVVYASFIADLTTELCSQLVFTVFGVAILAMRAGTNGHEAAVHEILIAVAAVAALAACALSVRWTLPLASRLIEVALPATGATVARTSAKLRELYGFRGRIATAFVVNGIAWLASAAGAWLGLRLLRVDVDLLRILSLESLIFALRSVAFAVPGGLGVQEAGYGVLGPLLGIPTEAAVLIALLKRVRDVAIGVPVLALWQGLQVRRLVAGASV